MYEKCVFVGLFPILLPLLLLCFGDDVLLLRVRRVLLLSDVKTPSRLVLFPHAKLSAKHLSQSRVTSINLTNIGLTSWTSVPSLIKCFFCGETPMSSALASSLRSLPQSFRLHPTDTDRKRRVESTPVHQGALPSAAWWRGEELQTHVSRSPSRPSLIKCKSQEFESGQPPKNVNGPRGHH